MTPHPPPPDAATTDTWAAPVANAPHRRAALAAAIGLEEKLDGAYADAARVVHDAGMLQTLATIAGSHAMQRATLRAAAGRPPLDEPGVNARWRNP